MKLKKYLYITRPLLCCRWIERDPTAGPPPMPFPDVMDAAGISAELREALAALVQLKKSSVELDEGEPVRCINTFIDSELARLRGVAEVMPIGHGNPGDLDDFFCSVYVGES